MAKEGAWSGGLPVVKVGPGSFGVVSLPEAIVVAYTRSPEGKTRKFG